MREDFYFFLTNKNINDVSKTKNMKTIRPLTFLREEEEDEFESFNKIKYKKIKFLGSGNFGTVFLATTKTTSNELFAIKSIKKEKTIDFEREMKILKKISNFFIVSYVDSFYDELNFNIVMEYVNGFDLNQLIDLHFKFSEIILSKIIHQVMNKLKKKKFF